MNRSKETPPAVQDSFAAVVREVSVRGLAWFAVLFLLHLEGFWTPSLADHLAAAWKLAIGDLGPYFIVSVLGAMVLALAPKSSVLLRSVIRPNAVWVAGLGVVLVAFARSVSSGLVLPAIPGIVVGALLQALSASVDVHPIQVAHQLLLDDSPRRAEDGDQLARGVLVHRLDAALRSPHLLCPTVAITGVLGSGKSSIANFVAARLEKDGRPVCRLDAWRYSNPEQADEALQSTIDEALTVAMAGYVPQHVGLRGVVGKVVRGLLGERAWAAPLAAKLEARIAVGQHRLAAALRKALPPGTRLVVVVENLERCRPEVAFELLQKISDVFRVQGLGYILCYDHDGLFERLVEAGLVRRTQVDFLEKIIDLRVHLDDLEAGTLGDLLSEGLRGVFSEPHHPIAVETLRQVGPSTPRQAKRLLAFLRFFLESRGLPPPWVDPKHVLVIANLEFHYPGFIDLADRRAEEVSRLSLRRHVATALGPNLQASPGLIPAPLREVFGSWGLRIPDGDTRFERLAQHAVDSGVFGFELQRQLDYLQGRKAHALTEFGPEAERLGSDGDMVGLERLVAGRSAADAVSLLLTAQNALLESIADAMTVQRQKALATQAETLHSMILGKIDRLEDGHAPLLARCAAMLPTYGELGGPFARLNQHVWLECSRLIERAPDRERRSMREGLSPRDFGPGSAARWLGQLLEGASAQSTPEVFAELLGFFRARGGVYALLSLPERFHDKERFFGRGSALRNPEVWAEWIKLLEEEARDDETVLDNVQALFIALVDGVSDAAGFTRVLLDQRGNGLAAVWALLVRRPLNRRMWGSLRSKRGELKEYLPDRASLDDEFPVPDWAAEQERWWAEERFTPPSE